MKNVKKKCHINLIVLPQKKAKKKKRIIGKAIQIQNAATIHLVGVEVLTRGENLDLLVALHQSQGTMNVCTKFPSNPSNSCQHTSVWTRVVNSLTDRQCHPQSPLLGKMKSFETN